MFSWLFSKPDETQSTHENEVVSLPDEPHHEEEIKKTSNLKWHEKAILYSNLVANIFIIIALYKKK
jgi:hypothetical protein